jgi:hypothetical protein
MKKKKKLIDEMRNNALSAGSFIAPLNSLLG